MKDGLLGVVFMIAEIAGPAAPLKTEVGKEESSYLSFGEAVRKAQKEDKQKRRACFYFKVNKPMKEEVA